MGDKKQKEAMTKKVTQVLVVGACVIFVILMILSGMGSHWLTMFTVVKPGDNVIISYTLNDATGNPVLTTDQQVYNKLVAGGKGIVLSKQLAVSANQSVTTPIYPVPIFTSNSGSTQQFALFSSEYNAISMAIVGMKTGDLKKVTLSPASTMTQTWSAEQLLRNQVNISDISIGDSLAMGVSDNPTAMVNNTSTVTYTRIGEITSKSDAGVVVDFGYPTADVSIISINAANS